MLPSPFDCGKARFWFVVAALLGLYLTARGYRSYEGDQAYRLPLLVHRLDPHALANDPFVRAFDAFNPHTAYIELLAVGTRVLGLDATLFVLWLAAFVAMAVGIGRLASLASHQAVASSVAVGLVLLARAGNIGTNHLFEPILLDRLVVLGLGWIAFASAAAEPSRGTWWPALLLGVGAVLHPSLGALLIGLLGLAQVVWMTGAAREGVSAKCTARSLLFLAIGFLPAYLIHGGKGAVIFNGLSTEEFRLLSFYVQSPQHLMPDVWRFQQWLAWGCFPLLAWIAWQRDTDRQNPSRRRILLLTLTCYALVGGAWVGVELFRSTTLTVLQPFRLATVARGLCLVLLAGHVSRLWTMPSELGRVRAALLAAGLCSDWALIVATAIELTCQLPSRPLFRLSVASVLFIIGVSYLVQHDPERGYIPLVIGSAIGFLLTATRGIESIEWTFGRRARILAIAWAVPILALAAGLCPRFDLGRSLAERCRFVGRPIDDLERLATWCRDHTPSDVRFIGPPGPKTFRLWSERAVAFNRAASPYHAAGLADWAERFKRHVAFEGSTEAFARAYLENHHALESRFDRLSPAELVDLARSQDAGYLLKQTIEVGDLAGWVPIRTEGAYTVYRLDDEPSSLSLLPHPSPR
jgi:Domain of unknown function (DUF6798)